VAYVRTVRTTSGATAVQIVWSSRRGSRRIEHIGSAHDETELAALKAAAAHRLAGAQDQLALALGLGAGSTLRGGALPITSSRMGHLWEALERAYTAIGLDAATESDPVFKGLALARIVEPTSKVDSLRVLEEVGVPAVSYATLKRRLPAYAEDSWRDTLAKACAARAALGPASLVLYDVSTLHFEIDEPDGFREPGFSKERRLDPQITIGLLTDATGFPLALQAFEGNKAETATMLPTITAFMKAHQLPDVTVVADAGMLSEANREALEDAGLSYIIGARIPQVPWQVLAWRKAHASTVIGEDGASKERVEQIPDGNVFTQPWPATEKQRAAGRRDKTIFYRYKADSARKTLRGIDAQVAKAERAVEGNTPIKRNRFVRLTGGERSVNRELEDKARALAGLKGYITNLPDPDPKQVIEAYHQLWRIEKTFRMSKHDLQARPIYHHKRASIDAHLNVVFAALAVTRYIEARTGWSIKRFVRTARRYRTIQIRAGSQTLIAEDPLPEDLRDALAMIN